MDILWPLPLYLALVAAGVYSVRHIAKRRRIKSLCHHDWHVLEPTEKQWGRWHALKNYGPNSAVCRDRICKTCDLVDMQFSEQLHDLEKRLEAVEGFDRRLEAHRELDEYLDN